MPSSARSARFVCRLACLAIAAMIAMVAAPLAHAQTTLNATYTSTAWDNTSSLATGSGLTINLGLGFEYLIVGGGGGGGGNIGGGGGAGGFATNVGGAATPQAAGNYAVAVGLGGAGGSINNPGSNGGASSVFGVTASGGGGGAFYNANTGIGTSGSSGASGGGGSPSNSGGAGGGSTSGSGLGNAGGSGVNTGANGYRAGGGGGAGSAGATTSSSVTGTGGSGLTSAITGVTGTYAAGGGGGATGTGNAGTGGSGIGGNGGSGVVNGTNGAANTGSGGGGGGYNGGFNAVTGGTGGSGIVIVRYQSGTRLASGGSSSGTTGVWQFETFTSSGTLALSYLAANLLATQSGTISGAGGLTYNSAGTLTLTAANTFSGATRVQAGTLTLGSTNALQNSTLDMNATDAGTIGFGVAGTTTYNLGGLQGSRNLANGGNTLAVGGNAASTTYSGGLSGTGGLTKTGAGALTLSGSNTYSGGTRLSAGTIVAGNDAALGTATLTFASAGVTLSATGNRTLANDIALEASGTIAIGGSPATLSGVISGVGGLTKTGTGTLALSGVNSYSGGTLITGGSNANSTVRLGSNSALGTGTVTISGSNFGTGSTLDLNGTTIANPIVIQALGSGVADAGVLQNGNTSMTAVVNGPVSIGGNNYVGGDGSITFNGVISGGINSYALFKQGSGTWTLANTANTFDGLYYQIGGVTEVTKLANQGETSSLGQASASQNSVFFGFNGSGGGTLRFIGSAASTSDRAFSLRGATAAANNVIEAAGTSDAATLTLTGPLSAGAAGSYAATLTGTNAGVNVYAGAIANGSGSLALVKQGSTTWALTGANSYTGATTVSSGTLKVGNSGTTGVLGGGGVSVAAGATLAFDRTDSGLVVADIISGSGTILQIGSGTTSLTGANTYTSPTQITAGTLRIGNGSAAGTLGSGSVAIAAGAALAFNRSDAITVSNPIGGAGAVVKQAANTLTLSGTNTYSGGTRLTAGTLIVGGDQALGTGTLSFATAGATLQTSRNVTVPIAVDANGALAIVGSGVDLTANFSGNATLSKTGTGTLTLSGPASTFSGNLVIAGGVGANSIVRAGNAAAFGTGTVTISGSGSNTGSTFDLNGNSLDNSLVIGLGNSGVNDAGALMNSNAAVPAVLNGGVSLGGEIYVGGAGSITFNGVMSGTVNPANDYALYKDGAGTWTYANTANTFDGFYYQVAGVTEVTKLANLNQASSLGQPTTSGRNRVSFGFNGSGGGTIRFIGSAASTSDREFVLSGGTAAATNVIEANGTSPAATLTLTGNLSANRAGTYAATLGGTNAGVNVFGGTIANGSASSLALVKQGSTTWALTAANTYTGSTAIAAGTLQIGNGGATGELGGVGDVANDGVLAVNRSNAFSLSRVIRGGGAFHQLGTGTTTLSGANTYSGGTVVSAGRLVGTTTSLQGAITNDATVEFAQTVGGTYSGVMAGSGALVKTGNALLAVTADNALAGLTAISAGTLQVGTGGGSGSLGSGDIANAAALVVNRTGTLTIPGAISGTGSLTKQGAGNLILSGSSSYTGATSVAAGRLSVNGVLGDSFVAVLAAAELSGSGTIGGPVSIGSGGTLSPGNSIESLATGSATFAAAAGYEYEVDSTNLGALGTAADLLVVSGDLNLDPNDGTLLFFSDLASAPQPFVNDTTIFALINYSGSWNGGLFTYNGTVLTDGSRFMVGSQEWEIDYDRMSSDGLTNFIGDYLPNSSFVAITAVPEPSTLVLMAIGAGLVVMASRRQRA